MGVAFVVQPTFNLNPLATIIGLAGAVCSASAYITVRKMRAKEHEYIIILYFVVFSIIASFPGIFYDYVPLRSNDWLLLIGIAVGTLGGQVFMTRGLHLVKAAKATHISYSNVLFTILWGSLIWNKFPNLLAVLGIIVIIFSIYMLNKREND